MTNLATTAVPFFGARKFAQQLLSELAELRSQHEKAQSQLKELGALTFQQLEDRRRMLSQTIAELESKLRDDKSRIQGEMDSLTSSLADLKSKVVKTEELVLLQEAGIYQYCKNRGQSTIL